MLILEGGGEGKLRGLAKSVISDGSYREERIDHYGYLSHKAGHVKPKCSTNEQKLVQQLRNSNHHITLNIHNRYENKDSVSCGCLIRTCTPNGTQSHDQIIPLHLRPQRYQHALLLHQN